MASGQQTVRKTLAYDTNILYDLAFKTEEATLDLHSAVRKIGFEVVVPNTALEELGHSSECNPDPEIRAAAQCALESFGIWGIEPLAISPTERGIVDQAAKRLLDRGYLPNDQRNDALIIAEAAIRSVPFLISTDPHLADVDSKSLAFELTAIHLDPVLVIRPRSFFAMLRKTGVLP